MKTLHIKISSLIVGTLIALAPAGASACTVCFGAASDPETSVSITLAMLTLVGVTAIVWGGIGMFFINMSKRARMLEPGTLVVTEQGEMREKRTTGEHDG